MASYSTELVNLMEQGLFEVIPPAIEHVTNSEAQHYDGRLLEDYATTAELPILGSVSVSAGTPVELKTCQEWIDDNGSRNGRRRGRWKVQRGAHEVLVDAGGVYCLLVLDVDEVIDGRILPAPELGAVVSWTNGGSKYSTQRAIVPWSRVISHTG